MSQVVTGWLECRPESRIYLVLSAFDRFAAGSQHFLYSILELCNVARFTVLGLSNRCVVFLGLLVSNEHRM